MQRESHFTSARYLASLVATFGGLLGSTIVACSSDETAPTPESDGGTASNSDSGKADAAPDSASADASADKPWTAVAPTPSTSSNLRAIASCTSLSSSEIYVIGDGKSAFTLNPKSGALATISPPASGGDFLSLGVSDDCDAVLVGRPAGVLSVYDMSASAKPVLQQTLNDRAWSNLSFDASHDLRSVSVWSDVAVYDYAVWGDGYGAEYRSNEPGQKISAIPGLSNVKLRGASPGTYLAGVAASGFGVILKWPGAIAGVPDLLVANAPKAFNAVSTFTINTKEGKISKAFVAVGDNGQVYLSTDGKTFQSESSGTTEDLYAVFGGPWASPKSFDVFAVGANGTIVHRNADGVWSKEASGSSQALRGGTWLYAVSGDKEILVVGDSGTILRRVPLVP